MAKTAERNTSGHPAGVTASKTEMPTRGPLGSGCGKTYNSIDTDPASDRAGRRSASLHVAADLCLDASGPCCNQTQAIANSRFGKAAWYDLVGRETASGEILDTVTATAANLTLPLGSFAKVTDLDNGRSVVVKINDRGPYTRGRILDLSPRAAEELHMKTAGVAAVVIEPIANEIDPVADVLPDPGAVMAP